MRFFAPGSYTLEVYAPGYPRCTTQVEVKPMGPPLNCDFALGPGPDVALEGFAVSDSGEYGQQGDGNCQINPGEVVMLLPKVRNDGATVARDLAATLRCQSPLVDVVADSLLLGNLSPGESMQPTRGFLLRIALEAQPGDLLPLDVHLVDAQGSNWQLPSSLRLQGFNDDIESGREQWTHGAFPGASNQQDDWQYGQPLGEGNDPSFAHSGRFVWGTDLGAGDLNGRYANNVHTYLQMRTLNCRGWEHVYLSFSRWLNVQQGDRAYITVNGQAVWDNQYQTITESSWSYQVVDLSAVAAERDSVVIRFCLWSNSSGTDGGWTIDDVVVSDKVQVGVAEAKSHRPASCALRQNYPNPFNASTTLAFTLGKRSEVSVTIYNLAGQEVRRLLAGPLPEGEHRVQWGGDDEAGRPVASGVYLATLRGLDETHSIKLLLVR